MRLELTELVKVANDARAPAGRCNGVHLHPLDFAFRCFAEHYLCTESETDSILQSEIRQQILVFHKWTLDRYTLQPLTSLWVCTPEKNLVSA